jgi:hypothetical protein
MTVPFFIAGGVKIIYDLLLYRAFVTHQFEHRLVEDILGPRAKGHKQLI